VGTKATNQDNTHDEIIIKCSTKTPGLVPYQLNPKRWILHRETLRGADPIAAS
jgi:hypothetical protein